MRIAYVFDPLLPQTETDTEQALNTVTALGNAGADVVMFLPRPTFGRSASPEEIRDYYKLERAPNIVFQRSLYAFPWLKPGQISPFRAIEKLAHAGRAFLTRKLHDFDVIYTRNVPAVAAALAAGHRVAYETYRPWPAQHSALGPPMAALMRRRRFLGAVLHSAYTKAVFEGIGVERDRLEVVYNGYWPALFEPRLSKAEARAQLGLAPDRPLVLYSGRVSMGKGLGLVLEVAETMPDVDFCFVGSERHGEVEERAQRLANVRIVPWAPFDELPPYLFASDILLIPPSSIPLQQVGNTVLPMKLFLYLAAERPILAPVSPDTAELLEHGDNSWLIGPDSREEAERGIRRLLGDSQLAGRISRRAGEMAAELTWDARAHKILDFLSRRIAAIG